MTDSLPRGVVIAAPRSGSGKTTVTLALLRALSRAGHRVAGAKCGPDYIDPAFHARACGRPSLNLDSWAMTPDAVAALAAEAGAGGATVICEGLMGLFDGVPAPAGRSGSTADIAAALGWPVLLVHDATGQAQSAAAQIAGCLAFDPRIRIAGIILNRVGSARHRRLIEAGLARFGVPVIASLPKAPHLALPERHLGLVQAGETADLDTRLDAMADFVAAHVPLDRVLGLASHVELRADEERQHLATSLTRSSPEGACRSTHGIATAAEWANVNRSASFYTLPSAAADEKQARGHGKEPLFSHSPYAEEARRAVSKHAQRPASFETPPAAAPQDEGRGWNHTLRHDHRFVQHDRPRPVPTQDERAITRSALPSAEFTTALLPPPGRRIALARDAAFSFIYPHLLAGWRRAGAEILPFSPLADEPPPDGADACWLPGGYPELHGGRLAAASRFLGGLRRFAETRPVHGECGGYMVLGESLVDAAGAAHAMAGLLAVRTSFAQRKLHLGYREATLLAPTCLGPAGTRLRGHEFHYATVLDRGADPPLASVRTVYDEPAEAAGSRRGHVTGSFFHALAALQQIAL